MSQITIKIYSTKNGKEPYSDWFYQLEEDTKAIIRTRLARIKLGNFGSTKPVKGYKNLYEIVIDYGPGYRIYFSKIGLVIIILLIGGEKKTQHRDIEKAKKYLLDHKENK